MLRLDWPLCVKQMVVSRKSDRHDMRFCKMPGRQKKGWIDCVKHHLQQRGSDVRQEEECVKDRKQRRKFIIHSRRRNIGNARVHEEVQDRLETRLCWQRANLRQARRLTSTRVIGIRMQLSGLIRTRIRMSAGSLSKCCGFITLSA